MFAPRYTAITIPIPMASALGSARPGSRISPATMFVCCQPPIVNSTATNAAATPLASGGATGATTVGGAPGLSARPITISAPSAAIFEIVNTLAVTVPGFTPR